MPVNIIIIIIIVLSSLNDAFHVLSSHYDHNPLLIFEACKIWGNQVMQIISVLIDGTDFGSIEWYIYRGGGCLCENEVVHEVNQNLVPTLTKLCDFAILNEAGKGANQMLTWNRHDRHTQSPQVMIPFHTMLHSWCSSVSVLEIIAIKLRFCVTRIIYIR